VDDDEEDVIGNFLFDEKKGVDNILGGV